jgi:GT2 family glycosyltransferase
VDVSIIIVNYNTFELSCSCIESVIKHTQNISYEIILVDNASTECPPDLFLQKFPSVKLVKNSVNSGFTGGNNLGIENANGKIILLLNSDVFLTENSILKCLEVLKNDTKTGVISCMLKFPDSSIQKQCQRFPSILLSTIELFRIHKFIPQPKRGILMGNGFFDHLTSIYCDSVWGAFFMFPKKILDKFENKKLPGDFFMYAEDLLWCYRIKKAGYRIYYNADTSVIHHLGASSSESVLKFKHQNEYNFIIKYYGWLYAKTLVLIRAILYATNSRKGYASEISRIYLSLFIKGELI